MEKTLKLEISHTTSGGKVHYGILELPASELEIEDSLQQARTNAEHQEFDELAVYHCKPLRGLLGKRLDGSSIKELNEMDQLRDTAHHPFFQSEEANSLYNAVKQSQISMNYDIPEDIETRRIKKELLCKSMSVPFYIWQVQREKQDYEYDNATEFSGMKAMLDIYKSEGNTQFVPEIEALFGVIEKNYKYSETKITEKHA